VGCGVCLARCQPKIFELCNDKSYISVRRLAACVLCRECETYCPIGIVHLNVEAADKAAPGARPAPAAAEPKT
jgi:Fe-S-cluster-containing hydrogenase component 2